LFEPRKLRISAPVAAFQILTGARLTRPKAAVADASHFPSGLKATLKTGPVSLRSVNRSWPVAASQILISPGSAVPHWPEPEASQRPSGLKATLWTPIVCPRKVRASGWDQRLRRDHSQPRSSG